MSDINDGGPAFPLQVTDETTAAASFRGMSLRDYFAAHAMGPLIRTVQKGGKTGPDAHEEDFDWVARRAYWAADAMLRAREA